MISAPTAAGLAELRERICREPWNMDWRRLAADFCEDTREEPWESLCWLIRSQLEVAEMPQGTTEWSKVRILADRIAALLAAHGREWSAPLVEKLPRCERCKGEGSIRPIDDLPGPWLTCLDCSGSGLAVAWSWGPVWPDVEVTGTVEQVVGVRCGECENGAVSVNPIFSFKCEACRGTGYVGGLAATLPKLMCVAWRLGDRKPTEITHAPPAFPWFWQYYVSDELNPTFRLPMELIRLIAPMAGDVFRRNEDGRECINCYFETREKAVVAAATACRDVGRAWCDLPKWPGE